MAQEIGQDTKVTLDLKTISMIVGFTVSLCSMYFVLQADIAKAMEMPKPEVTKTEFTYKDQIIRDAIMTTQEDVKEMKETLSFMKKEDGVLCIDKGRSRNSSRQVKEYLRSKNSSICSANERKYMSAENVSNYTMHSTKSSSNVSKLDSASCQENISSSKSFAKSFFGKLRRKKKAQRQYTPTI